MTALSGLVRKETYHILRDRRTLLVVLLMPVIQVLLFGYAIRTDVEEVRLVMVDPAPDNATRELTRRFEASPLYRVVAVRRTTDDLDDLFIRRVADQAVVLPPEFSRRLRAASGADVLVVTDAAAPVTATAVESFARRVLGEFARDEQAVAGMLSPEARPVSVRAQVRFRFNPTLESRFLFVPGILAFVLTIISALMTAITLSREKETGTLEVLLVSPLRPRDIVLGKVLPYLALAFFNAVTTLGIAWFVFDVPMRGSLFLLLAESLLFVAVCLALGVLISTRTPSQRAAMIAVLLGTLLPTALLSGMIFPIESMPDWLQPVTTIVPARWFITVVRGIMLKGATLQVLWLETLVLAAMTIVLLVASIRSFKVRLE